jgi:hypothetical protein
MPEKDRKDDRARPLAWAGMVALLFAALLLYAGYLFAMRDVCAAYIRLISACLIAIAASAVAVILSVSSSRRIEGWPRKLLAYGVVIASAALAVYAGSLMLWVSSFAEFATDIRVSDEQGLRFDLDKGFRVSALEVSGPGVRWRIEAVEGLRPPLVRQVGGFAFGHAPEGYVQTQPSSEGQLKDGLYRVEAIVLCAYRPAVAQFTLRGSRIGKQ